MGLLGASRSNIKRSLEKYFNDRLNILEGLAIQWEGLPFDNISKSEWLMPRIMDFNPVYMRQGSATEYADDLNIMFSVNIFIKKSSLTITDKHYLIRDSIIKYFKIGEDIDLNDWVGDGSYICKMRVREVIEDSSLGEIDDLLSYRVVLGINYTESSMLDY